MIQIDVDKNEVLVGMKGDLTGLTTELLQGVSEVLWGIKEQTSLPLEHIVAVFTLGLPPALELTKKKHESKSSD